MGGHDSRHFAKKSHEVSQVAQNNLPDQTTPAKSGKLLDLPKLMLSKIML